MLVRGAGRVIGRVRVGICRLGFRKRAKESTGQTAVAQNDRTAFGEGSRHVTARNQRAADKNDRSKTR
jgi:hypothetical protein